MIDIKNQPKVSVLMTVYNREKFVVEAIDSVLNSTYTNFELILVDDCSTDSSLAIAKSFEAKDSRVKVFKNGTNLGDYGNRNQAASYGTGKYIKYVDSDDKLYPWSLEYCVQMMEQCSNATIGIFLLSPESYHGSFTIDSLEALTTHWLKRQILSIGPSGCIYSRTAFEALGGFDTRFGVAADCYFHNRLAGLGSVILLPKVFFYYRLHDGQEMNNTKAYLVNNLKYQYQLLFKDEIKLSPVLLNRIKWNFVKRQFLFVLKCIFRLNYGELCIYLDTWLKMFKRKPAK